MFEFLVLLVSTTPLLVGLYALRKINERDDDGSDDQPPPPDPEPPAPSTPTTPRGSSRSRWAAPQTERVPARRLRHRRSMPQPAFPRMRIIR